MGGADGVISLCIKRDFLLELTTSDFPVVFVSHGLRYGQITTERGMIVRQTESIIKATRVATVS